LVGLEARLPNGSVIGPVSAVVVAESQSRLVIVTSEGEREVPFVAELVPEVSVAEGFLVVAAINGLLD
jgi:16S rRNA processing protein RimM